MDKYEGKAARRTFLFVKPIVIRTKTSLVLRVSEETCFIKLSGPFVSLGFCERFNHSACCSSVKKMLTEVSVQWMAKNGYQHSRIWRMESRMRC